jgi:hypothetical protein
MEKSEPAKPSTSGHYSWNANTAARAEELERLGVTTAPQRLSDGAAAGAAAGGGGSLSPHASAWNSAGTWEERVVTSTAHAALRARLLGANFPASPRLRVAAVTALSGEVRLVCVRGKVRCGFDLRLEVAWELAVEGGGVAAAGTFSASLEDTDPDLFDELDVKVKSNNGVPKGEVIALVKLADGRLREIVREWVKATTAVPL